MDGVIGEVRMFVGNFAARAWALCNGKIMDVSQNQSLYSIIGTSYGGDGRVTFGLPNLTGRIPVGAGQGAGLSHYSLGENGGAEYHVLKESQLPPL